MSLINPIIFVTCNSEYTTSFQNHEANNPAVRLRICQLLSMLLRQMGAKAAIDNELYDIIYDTMLHRLQDKTPGVRKEAVMALTRLQDPHSRECPVIEGNVIIFHILALSFSIIYISRTCFSLFNHIYFTYLLYLYKSQPLWSCIPICAIFNL